MGKMFSVRNIQAANALLRICVFIDSQKLRDLCVSARNEIRQVFLGNGLWRFCGGFCETVLPLTLAYTSGSVLMSVPLVAFLVG